MKLNLCHLYPDLLDYNGDRGNLLCLRRRLEWRGIQVALTALPVDAEADLTSFDLLYLGGGEDALSPALLEDLRGGRGSALRAAILSDRVLLAVCGGFQLLGRWIETADGRRVEGLGALDFHTESRPQRVTGNFSFDCLPGSGIGPVVGFENHSGRTVLGPDAAPLGRVLTGSGNNGTDGTEGVHVRNVFGTWSHGPVLAKNPAFCDHILLTALRLHDPDAELPPLDDTVELAARDEMLRRLARP